MIFLAREQLNFSNVRKFYLASYEPDLICIICLYVVVLDACFRL